MSELKYPLSYLIAISAQSEDCSHIEQGNVEANFLQPPSYSELGVLKQRYCEQVSERTDKKFPPEKCFIMFMCQLRAV